MPRLKASRGERLTDRELEVLAYLANGSKAAEISRLLDITHGTVQAHARHIMQKLGAATRAHAVALAFRSGVLPGAVAACAEKSSEDGHDALERKLTSLFHEFERRHGPGWIADVLQRRLGYSGDGQQAREDMP